MKNGMFMFECFYTVFILIPVRTSKTKYVFQIPFLEFLKNIGHMVT